MSGSDCPVFHLPDDAAATRFGTALAGGLVAGKPLLLHGPLGAGKTHIARAVIRALAGEGTEVPSPTFTLVQVYDAPGAEVWHADLYRLTHPDEVIELGLLEAMDHAIVLIEWPERLGSLTPANAMHITLDYLGDGRSARIRGASDRQLCQLQDFAA